MRHDITYMCNLKNTKKKKKQNSEYNKTKAKQNKETDSQIQRTNKWLPVGRRTRGGAIQVQGLKRYELVCIKLVTQKDCTTQEYSQYFIITVNGL